jgi:hypothetical protein
MEYGDRVSVPTRAEVEARWRDILAGSRSREEVHAWTRPWVEGDSKVAEDPLVSIGLTHLHGFDLTTTAAEPHLVRHGMEPGRVYCKSDAVIAEELASWEQSVAFYDGDREGWHRQKWLRLIRAARNERGADAARGVANRAMALGQLDEQSATHALEERDTVD